MNDIKERAKEYAKNQLWGIALEDDEYEQRYNSIVELYLEIATEQKAVDIERAKKAFCKNFCKGYRDTGRCFVDGSCKAYQMFCESLEE